MPKATHIQEYGNLRIALHDNGRKVLFLPTPTSLWISTTPPFPEIELPPFKKTVINSNIPFLFGNRSPLWAVTSGTNIVVAARIGTLTPRRIYYSTDGGASFILSDAPDGSSGQYGWVKVIDGRIYTGGANLMVSEDDGVTWDEVFSGAIAGIAKSPTEYVAIPLGYNAAQPGATSTDGLTFTSFVPVIQHEVGQAFNGYSTSQETNGIEYFNGAFYSFGRQHEHFPDAAFPGIDGTYPTGRRWVLFTSADGGTWTEITVDAGPDAALSGGWIGSNGPYFALDAAYLVATPYKGSYGYFHWRNTLGWDNDAADPQPLNPVSSADIPGVADLLGQWLNKADSRVWYANNLGAGDGVTNAYEGSDILTSIGGSLNPFIPYPVFNETAWYVTAKAVDWNDHLLVFERATTPSAGPGIPISAVSRLVRIEPDA
jgi:hypothetical protein